jgi:DNA-binding NarL/FixJ family response regulator
MLTLDQEMVVVRHARITCRRSPRRPMLLINKASRVTDIGKRILTLFSPKELCVARLLIAEGTNRAIAGKMGISPETVKAHLVHMFHKVGVQDRLSLAMALIRHGVVACPCGDLCSGSTTSNSDCALRA